MAAVQTPDGPEVGGVGRRPVGDAEQGQVGQDEARRHVPGRRLALPPGGDGLGHAPALAPEAPALLHPPPRSIRVLRAAGPAPQLLALVDGPRQPAPGVELLGQTVVDGEEMGDVRGRVLQLTIAQGAGGPVADAVALREADAEQALDQRAE